MEVSAQSFPRGLWFDDSFCLGTTNNPGGGKISDEEEYDLLSEIINEINEFYGKVPEGTEDGSKKLITDLVNDKRFKQREFYQAFNKRFPE